jgi:DnaK suppressor protein
MKREESMESNNGVIKYSVVEGAEGRSMEEDISREKENFQSRFMRSLIARKDEVERALTALIESQKEHKESFSADDFIEYFDQTERDISANRHYTLLSRKSRELQKIEFLIKRAFTDKDFGRCEECGGKIPEERLLVVPETTLCVACQRELEKMDSRRSLSERSYASVGGKKSLQWEDEEDSGSKGGFIIETDADDGSVDGLEEIDLEDALKEKMK